MRLADLAFEMLSVVVATWGVGRERRENTNAREVGGTAATQCIEWIGCMEDGRKETTAQRGAVLTA